MKTRIELNMGKGPHIVDILGSVAGNDVVVSIHGDYVNSIKLTFLGTMLTFGTDQNPLAVTWKENQRSVVVHYGHFSSRFLTINDVPSCVIERLVELWEGSGEYILDIGDGDIIAILGGEIAGTWVTVNLRGNKDKARATKLERESFYNYNNDSDIFPCSVTWANRDYRKDGTHVTIEYPYMSPHGMETRVIFLDAVPDRYLTVLDMLVHEK